MIDVTRPLGFGSEHGELPNQWSQVPVLASNEKLGVTLLLIIF